MLHICAKVGESNYCIFVTYCCLLFSFKLIRGLEDGVIYNRNFDGLTFDQHHLQQRGGLTNMLHNLANESLTSEADGLVAHAIGITTHMQPGRSTAQIQNLEKHRAPQSEIRRI